MSTGPRKSGPTLRLAPPFGVEAMEAFAKRLKELRTQRSLSQTSLAEMLEVSPRVYNRWERGAAIPRLDTVVKIADILQVSLDTLTGREDIKEPALKVRHPKLHDLYRQIDTLSAEDQQALLVLLDSLLKRSNMGKLLAG